MKLPILIWDYYYYYFYCYLQKRLLNFKMKGIIWEHKVEVIWEHILFPKFWSRILEVMGKGQEGQFLFSFLSVWNSNCISIKFLPVGSSAWCSQREAWIQPFLLNWPWMEKNDVCSLLLPPLPVRNLQSCLFSSRKVSLSSWNLALLFQPSCLPSAQEHGAEQAL